MDAPRGRGRGRGRGRREANPLDQSNVRSPFNVQSTNVCHASSVSQSPPISDSKKTKESTSIAKDNDQTRISSKSVAPEAKKQTVSSNVSSDLKLDKDNVQLAVRPGYGTVGRPIELITNHFILKLSGSVYHYDIDIISLDQKKKYGKNYRPTQITAAEAAESGIQRLEHELNKGVGKAKRKEVFEELIKCHSLHSYQPVYDGVKNVFTAKPLGIQSKQVFTVTLNFNGKDRKYEITIQPVKKETGSNQIFLEQLHNANDGEREIIMALNSIMNYRPAKSSQIQIGRSFFYLDQGKKVNLGEGLEIWFGYHQSIHSTEKGAAVVINLAAKAFHKEGPVIDYINDILRRDITRSEPMKPYELKNVSDALKGIKVEVTHLSYPRRYIVDGISKLSAQEMPLEVDGKKISIADYFSRKYGRLKFPHLHCLFMRASNKQTYIPFEHCKIFKGQPKLGKLSPSLGAKMIKDTAITPESRFKAIEMSSRDVNKESGEKMRNFNLFLDLRNQFVNGRVLNPPCLSYEKESSTLPDIRGVWNMSGNKFRSFINIESWIILDFAECTEQNIGKLLSFLAEAGRKVGLNFGKPLAVKRCNRNISAERALLEAEKTKATFAFIILSRRDRFHSYDEIKFIADYRLQFVNQCIDEKILNRFNDQIATNLCLKINAKLGGVNHVLKNRSRIFSKPVMIVGADAVHSPRGSKCPSIAAVVASVDAHPFKYRIACRVQENPDGKQSQELILEMEEMMLSLLKEFYHCTRGKHPEKIIFFRDGVSEGQFQKVYAEEVSAVQSASEKQCGFIIPITYIVVQKRHQTRFRPANPREGVGRGGNVPPGTTVDRGIVHPHRFDYFLNSHEGIQGTSKSAHYTVLHDDSKFSSDELQELSYHLCYTYNKCNRSISIPAPVKYADLACYRAKNYADYHIQKEQDNSSASSGSSYHLPDHAKNAINTMGEKGKNFFFV